MALWIAFVSRPVVVGTILLVFRVPWRENLLICWSGLRGAVPIILATVPILALSTRDGVMDPGWARIYAFIFMAVVVGSFIPGFLVRPVTRWLDMKAGQSVEPAVEFDIVTGGDLEHLNKTFLVPEYSEADGRTLKELALPAGATVVVVLRGGKVIPPRGDTRILAGDHVMLVYRPEVTEILEEVFVKPRRC